MTTYPTTGHIVATPITVGFTLPSYGYIYGAGYMFLSLPVLITPIQYTLPVLKSHLAQFLLRRKHHLRHRLASSIF